uniref:Aspartyl/asparaginy/proline hydroxylase domain-containing protein n=1 Tax=Ciona savignyi TaxID=51511 RepID=H2YLM2_CIOSA
MWEFEVCLALLGEYWTQLVGVVLLILLGILNRNKTNDFTRCVNESCICCRRNKADKDDVMDVIRNAPDISERFKKLLSDHMTLPLSNGQHPTVFCLPGVRTRPFLDPRDYLRDADLLEGNSPMIRREFEAVWKETHCWQTNTTQHGEWWLFHLVNQGNEIPDNCAKCPLTMEVVHNMGSLMRGCGFGNVCFSVVKCGTFIDEHCGPCNTRTRCHLGLNVPEGFELMVGGESRSWEEGGFPFV